MKRLPVVRHRDDINRESGCDADMCFEHGSNRKGLAELDSLTIEKFRHFLRNTLYLIDGHFCRSVSPLHISLDILREDNGLFGADQEGLNGNDIAEKDIGLHMLAPGAAVLVREGEDGPELVR